MHADLYRPVVRAVAAAILGFTCGNIALYAGAPKPIAVVVALHLVAFVFRLSK